MANWGKIFGILAAVELVLVLGIMAMSSVDNKKLTTAYVVRDTPQSAENYFKLVTKAVCTEESKIVSCSDQLFVQCNGKEFLVKDKSVAVCDGKSIDLSGFAVNGSVKFRKS